MLPASTLPDVRSGRPSRRIRFRSVAGAALAAVLAVGLAGCTADPAAEAFGDGEQRAYTSADLTTVEFAPEERGEPVEFSGVTEHGEEFSSADIGGEVTVVNFWYAGCGPCRAEAEDLEATYQLHREDGVAFVGINILDNADTAIAFAENYGITYPSLMDAQSGQAKLAFARVTPIQAPPTTLVLDREGRIAARILGPIDGTSILSAMIKTVLAEKA